ncbi:hypothetical protein BGZ95_004477 [Linnemannia exigua]|uniref:Microbial-type PARG catalytic domain-containing protein n=1 Tax=Linnemannia exigua TaxID=604196 RepID=A0AAD4D3G8_9FUNG|nr:hypothetical protein BGZ95_004477 [Linnemannia exigua]
MPSRWSVVVLFLIALLSLLTFSRVTTSSYSSRSGSTRLVPKQKSRLLLHHLQEEQHLRDRNAQLIQDLEENELQLDIDCSSPPPHSSWSSSSSSSSTASSSNEELTLQRQDFELELALEVQHQMETHQYDSTLLNESPSALQRHLERKLRHQKRLLTAYKSSLHQQAIISYNSQECIAWRARQQQLQQKEQTQHRPSSTSTFRNLGNSLAAAALTRFQQFHPNRRNLDQDSIFAKTLVALGEKRYTDPNGFVVELDPVKVTAGSRRASSYLNDDLHVLVLDMQWDPEVTVVVGNVLDETVKLRQEGYRPIMLNVGNSNVPGGDYHLDSANSNEADLFRRTTLHQCLDQEPRRSRFYPLSEAGGVYCPNQAVFRRGHDRSNEFMDRFEWISVVSVAPIPKMETREKDGGLGGVQFLEGEDDLLRRRILAAMKVGVSQGHDALVLPPHGTEAGQNPSEAIAAIYRSIIGRDFMGGRKRFQTYKKIVMVLDPEQADRVVNETSNYRPPQPTPVATPLPVGDIDEETTESSSEAQDAEEEEQEEEEVVETESDLGSHIIRQRSSNEDFDVVGENEDDSSEDNDIDNEDEDEEEGEGRRVLPEVSDEMVLDENETEDDSGPSEDELEDQAMYGTSGADEEEAANELVPEDEVSESEVLLEEQEFQGDVELSEGGLAEDLNDIPVAVPESDEADAIQDDGGDSGETGGDDDDDNQGSDGDEDEEDEGTEEAAEVPFVPLVETVRQVFERMLEQRSLLIVKNRARGIIEPEVPADSTTTTTARAATSPLSA